MLVMVHEWGSKENNATGQSLFEALAQLGIVLRNDCNLNNFRKGRSDSVLHFFVECLGNLATTTPKTNFQQLSFNYDKTHTTRKQHTQRREGR